MNHSSRTHTPACCEICGASLRHLRWQWDKLDRPVCEPCMKVMTQPRPPAPPHYEKKSISWRMRIESLDDANRPLLFGSALALAALVTWLITR